MADIEALIKRRIADRQFDDVVRVLPPPPERKRKEVDLDDSKASKVRVREYERRAEVRRWSIRWKIHNFARVMRHNNDK